MIEVARRGDAAVVEAVAAVPDLPERLVRSRRAQPDAQSGRGRGRKRDRRSC